MNKPVHTHDWLNRIVKSLEGTLSQKDRAKLMKGLAQFHQSLETHIHDEDSATGWYHDVVRAEPRLSSTLDRLREHHQTLLESLERLRSDENRSLDDLRAEIQGILTLFRNHEKEEDNLMVELFYRDTGTPGGGS